MKIINIEVFGLENSIKKSGYPMQMGSPALLDDIEITEQDLKRITKLSKVKGSTGHDNFLKGIIVQFDLQYTQYFTKQLQRYHWIDFVSSQSQMHRLTYNTNVADSCNKYTLPSVCKKVDNLISIYNTHQFPARYIDEYSDFEIKSKEECFHYIISNCPMGYQLWAGITTNYLQLKTIYWQRCKPKHKLDEWRIFGEFIQSLPMSELITKKYDR